MSASMFEPRGALAFEPPGAAFLDRTIPHWWNAINEERFTIIHPERCVLGQLFGDYVQGLSIFGMLDATARDLGFNVSFQTQRFYFSLVKRIQFRTAHYCHRQLTNWWLVAIRRRKAESPNGTPRIPNIPAADTSDIRDWHAYCLAIYEAR